MRKQYKFIKHSKTDRYKSLKPADIESATTKSAVQSNHISYHNQATFKAGRETLPYKVLLVYAHRLQQLEAKEPTAAETFLTVRSKIKTAALNKNKKIHS